MITSMRAKIGNTWTPWMKPDEFDKKIRMSLDCEAIEVKEVFKFADLPEHYKTLMGSIGTN